LSLDGNGTRGDEFAKLIGLGTADRFKDADAVKLVKKVV
jgi:hypothetical protein